MLSQVKRIFTQYCCYFVPLNDLSVGLQLVPSIDVTEVELASSATKNLLGFAVNVQSEDSASSVTSLTLVPCLCRRAGTAVDVNRFLTEVITAHASGATGVPTARC